MLAKVTAREFASGSGLQVAFKFERWFFLSELDEDERSPGPELLGVDGIVVVEQPRTRI